MDPMLMMLPLPCLSICFADSWARVNIARIFTLYVFSSLDLGMSAGQTCIHIGGQTLRRLERRT